jgi:hypothetical protein
MWRRVSQASIRFPSAVEEAAESYDRNLTNGATLSALPQRPTFVFNGMHPPTTAESLVGAW